MATYPTLATLYGSDFKPVTKPAIDRAEDGTARVRNYGSDKGGAQLSHPWLSATDKATLDAFYAANRLLPFDYIALTDSVSRTCVFAAAPAYKREHGNYWSATVLLEQV